MVIFKEIHSKHLFFNEQIASDSLTCPYLKLWAWAPAGSPCRNPPTAVLTPSRLRFFSPSGSSSILTQGNTTVTCFLIIKTTMNTTAFIIYYSDCLASLKYIPLLWLDLFKFSPIHYILHLLLSSNLKFFLPTTKQI